MKLRNLIKVGRFVNPETNKPVNIHKGTRAGRCDDWYFFIRSGKRVYVGESFRNWQAATDL
jgi:hypothetical protein